MAPLLYVLTLLMFITTPLQAEKITQMLIAKDPTSTSCLYYLKNNNLYCHQLVEQAKDHPILVDENEFVRIYEDTRKGLETIQRRITCIGTPRIIEDEWIMPAVIQKSFLGGIRRTDICTIKRDISTENMYTATTVAEGHNKPVKKIEFYTEISSFSSFPPTTSIWSTSTAPTIKISSISPDGTQKEIKDRYLLDIISKANQDSVAYATTIHKSWFKKEIQITNIRASLKTVNTDNLFLTYLPQLFIAPDANLTPDIIAKNLQANANHPERITLYLLKESTIIVSRQTYRIDTTDNRSFFPEKPVQHVITASTFDFATNMLYLATWNAAKKQAFIQKQLITPPEPATHQILLEPKVVDE